MKQMGTIRITTAPRAQVVPSFPPEWGDGIRFATVAPGMRQDNRYHGKS